MLAPSRFLQHSDWAEYPPRLQALVQDKFGEKQHDFRLVEYLTCLHAAREHWLTEIPLTAVDVGGAGSPFPAMITEELGVRPTIVDPKIPGGSDLHHYLTKGPRLAHIVSCISVLEHVEDLPQMLYDLSCLVAPGGILLLTVDAVPGVEGDVVDTFHFHWMRTRIFTAETIRRDLLGPLVRYGLTPTAVEYDPAVPPSHWGYVPASLILTKPRKVSR